MLLLKIPRELLFWWAALSAASLGLVGLGALKGIDLIMWAGDFSIRTSDRLVRFSARELARRAGALDGEPCPARV